MGPPIRKPRALAIASALAFAMATAFALATVFGLLGCRREPPFVAETAYRQARMKFQQGDLTAALADTDAGLRRLASTPAAPSAAAFSTAPVSAAVPGASAPAPTALSPAVETWRFTVLKAEILTWRGTSAEALTLLASDPPPGVPPDLRVRRTMLQGLACSFLQRFDEAERYLQEAEAQVAAASREGHAMTGIAGEVALSQGTLAFLRSDPSRAEPLFQRALALAREARLPFLEANARGSLGLVFMRRYQYADAVDWFQSSLAIAESVQARSTMEKSLGNLGWSYLTMGELDRAAELFTTARAEALRLGLQKDQQIWLKHLGEIRLQQRDLDASVANYREALDVARRLQNKREIADGLTDLAAVLIERGELDEAARVNEEALALEREIGDRESDLYVVLNQARIATRRHDSAEAERAYRAVIARAGANVALRSNAEAGLAALEAAQGRVDLAEQDYRRAIVSIERARAASGREEFKLAALTRAKAIYDQYIDFLMTRGRPDAACAVADMSRAQTLTEGLGLRAPLSEADLASMAARCPRPAHGAALSYWLAPERSYVWVMTPTDVQMFTLPGEARIGELVSRHRKALVGPLDVTQANHGAGVELYRILVSPAAATLAQQPRVTVIPDGVLCGVNFETLIVPDPAPHFWIEDVSITNASALAMLAPSRAAAVVPPPKTLLLVGDPTPPAGGAYQPLQHAAAEMATIGAHVPADQRTVLSGAAATPSAYLAARPTDYALIHFVAHGTASRPSPLDSAVVLSSDGTSHNLTARMIATTPLRARLVTISACDSAGMRAYSGEGLVGLSWAFLRAGAHEVVAALWEVNDASTPRLMDRLYAGLAAGESPADALRAAKLAMLKSDSVYRRPFYWAPFVIYSGV